MSRLDTTIHHKRDGGHPSLLLGRTGHPELRSHALESAQLTWASIDAPLMRILHGPLYVNDPLYDKQAVLENRPTSSQHLLRFKQFSIHGEIGRRFNQHVECASFRLASLRPGY